MKSGIVVSLGLILNSLVMVPVVSSALVPMPQGKPSFDPSVRAGQPGVPKDWVGDGGAPERVRLWKLDPQGDGIALGGGGGISTRVNIPAVKEGTSPDEWWVWFGVEVAGTTEAGEGWLKAEVAQANGLGLARGTAKVAKAIVPPAPRRRVVSITGEQPGAPFSNALDGDPATVWHSRYSGGDVPHPHIIEWEFEKPYRVEGIRYLPRPDRGNGTITRWKLEWSKDGTNWEPPVEGEWNYRGENEWEQKAMLPRPDSVRMIRLVSLASGGGPWASAAEVGVLGEIPPAPPEAKPVVPPPAASLWLAVPASETSKLAGQQALFKIAHAQGKPVVVSSVHAYLLHRAPTEALLGKANGNNGPDKIGAGGLGFDALTEHGHRVFTILKVYPGTPAAQSGLAHGDVITAIDGIPMAEADLWASWDWFHHSHEARLGRAIDAAAARPDKTVRLSIQRAKDGTAGELALSLTGRPLLGPAFPYDNDASAALYRDLIEYVVKTQRDDGSWNDNQIHTALAGLALLGTRDRAHLPRLRKAAEWCLRKSPDPTKEKGLCYWWMGHQGTFLAEYHLATGDESVLPWIHSLLQWVPTGTHRTKWGYLGLGHGPEGLPYEEKGLVAPAVHLSMADALGQFCGGSSTFWDTMWPYLLDTWSDIENGGHGALGYNASYRDLEEFWFRTGLFSGALNVSDQRPDMQAAMTRVMRSRHPWFRNSHAYGEPGAAWGFVGLSRVSPQRFRETLQAYRWSFSLAWQPGHGLRFSTPSMGAPYMGEEDLINPAYAVVLSARHRGLWITGARDRNWLRSGAASSAVRPASGEVPSLLVIAGIGDADEEVQSAANRSQRMAKPVLDPLGGAAFPVRLLVDLGEPTRLDAIEMAFAAGGTMPTRMKIHSGKPGGAWEPTGIEFQFTRPQAMVEIPFGPALETRRVLIEIDGPPGAIPAVEAIRAREAN